MGTPPLIAVNEVEVLYTIEEFALLLNCVTPSIASPAEVAVLDSLEFRDIINTVDSFNLF